MEDRDVQRVWNMMRDTIKDAKGSTFNQDKCMVSRAELLDILEELESKLPLELKHARELLAKRRQYVEDAEKDVTKMLRQAEQEANSITTRAKQEAETLTTRAKQEAETMTARAKQEAATIISESETLERARQKSKEIIRRAEDRTQELYQVANSYTEDALNRTEDAIRAALSEVQESHQRFHSVSIEKLRELKAGPQKKDETNEEPTEQ